MAEPRAPKADPGPGGYDVLSKWKSPSFNDITRGVLDKRLHEVPERRFFDPDQHRLLEAACARLIPQDRSEPAPIAPFIDADLFEGRGDGFRPPDTLPIPELWRRGLAGIEAEAKRRFGDAFAELEPANRDAVLRAVQAGDVAPESFTGVDPVHFFVQLLLKSAVAVYYAHPDAWNEIGYGGPASPRGYVRMGLDERDPWEAPLAPASGDRR